MFSPSSSSLSRPRLSAFGMEMVRASSLPVSKEIELSKEPDITVGKSDHLELFDRIEAEAMCGVVLMEVVEPHLARSTFRYQFLAVDEFEQRGFALAVAAHDVDPVALRTSKIGCQDLAVQSSTFSKLPSR